MGLFDSIRRMVGGGKSSTRDSPSQSDDGTPGLVDTSALDASVLREQAEAVADEADQLDFSLASLARFDSAIEAGYDDELPTSNDPATYPTDAVRFGAYLGEVLVRVYDGVWTDDPDWGVTVTGPLDSATVAVFDVADRSIRDEAVFASVADQVAVETGVNDDTTAEGDDTVGATDETEGDVADATAADTAAIDSAEPEQAESDDSDASASETAESDSAETDEVAALVEEAEPEAEGTPAEDDGAWFDGDESDESETSGETDDEADGQLLEPDELADSPGTSEPDETQSLEPDDTEEPDETQSLEPDETDTTADSAETRPSDSDGTQTPHPDETQTPDDARTSDEAATDDSTPADETETTPSVDPTAGDGLRAAHAIEAEEFVSFWSEHDLDYTPGSLDRLDTLVADEWDDDRFDDATFGSTETFDDRAFTSVTNELGSYFGEVLVRELDGEWTDATENESVVVEGPSGKLAIPVFRVAQTALREYPVFARSYDSLLSDLESSD